MSSTAVTESEPKGLVRYAASHVAAFRDGEDHIITVSVGQDELFEITLPASVAVMIHPRTDPTFLKGATV